MCICQRMCILGLGLMTYVSSHQQVDVRGCQTRQLGPRTRTAPHVALAFAKMNATEADQAIGRCVLGVRWGPRGGLAGLLAEFP